MLAVANGKTRFECLVTFLLCRSELFGGTRLHATPFWEVRHAP